MLEGSGYTIERELSPGRTWLARDLSGRCLVVKVLEADCLLEGDLHPSIRLRLERVQELPLSTVANLYGVERIGGVAYLVWEYIAGDTFEDSFSSPAELRSRGVELVRAVQALHATGLVHGAIHAGNVLIDERGSLRLTHISPLLHHDEHRDARDIALMLAACAEPGEMRQRIASTDSLREIVDALGPAGEARASDAGCTAQRARLLLWAACSAVAAVTLGVILYTWVGAG